MAGHCRGAEIGRAGVGGSYHDKQLAKRSGIDAEVAVTGHAAVRHGTPVVARLGAPLLLAMIGGHA